MSDKPWWFPRPTDAAWCAYIRSEYDDAADLSDDEIRNKYAEGQEYATTWDHCGDAYEQFKELADAYLALLKQKDPK